MTRSDHRRYDGAGRRDLRARQLLVRVLACVAVLGLAAGLAACGAGQLAQTAAHVSSVDGAHGRAGDVVVRDATIVPQDPAAGSRGYEPGDAAPLRLTIVNEGDEADQLIAVSSPVATSVSVTGDTRVPAGQVLAVGYRPPLGPEAAGTSPGAAITLVDLTEPLHPGLTYPLVLHFEKAGALRLDIPIAVPATAPPRSSRDQLP